MVPLTGLFTVAIIAIIITDIGAFYHLHQHPEDLTVRFTLLVIGITLLPIAIRYVILVG